MSKAKEFQGETDKRIIDINSGGQKRVLLSDEVGWGKTIRARTVIEMAKYLPGVSYDGIYRMILCFSANRRFHPNVLVQVITVLLELYCCPNPL